MSLSKYLNPKVIVESGEYLKDVNNKIIKVSDKAPTHDENVVIKEKGAVPTKKGRGGVELNNISKVVSDTQSNRNQKDSSYTEIDHIIGYTKDEAQQFAKNKFNIKINPKGLISPSELISQIHDKVEVEKSKIMKAPISETSYGGTTARIHSVLLNNLPTLEEIFDSVFDEQEEKKQNLELNNNTAQFGKDNTNVIISQKNKFLLNQKQDLDKALNIMDPKGESNFRTKYGTSSHAFRMKTNPEYKKKVEAQSKLNPEQVDYPKNNINRKDYVAPNNQFMFPNLTGEAQANMTNQTNDFIAGEVLGAIPFERALQKAEKLKKLFNTSPADEFLNSWYNDPEIKERLNNLTDIDRYADYYNHPPESIKFHDFESDIADGKSLGDFGNLFLNNKKLKNKGSNHINSVAVHEGTHAVNSNGLLYSYQERENLLKPFGLSPGEFRVKSQLNMFDEDAAYYLQPTEIHSRMNEARFKLNKKPTDKFTEEEVLSLINDKKSKASNFFGMGEYIKDTKAMTELLNKFYTGSAVGLGASKIEKKQQGGKGKLRPYPKMVGNRPMAIVDINDKKAIPVESVNKRTVSMDDIFDKDSVNIQGTNAKTFYNSKLKKYIR